MLENSGNKTIQASTLEESESLILYNRDGKVILRSSGKWLHPLFEVENYLLSHEINGEDVVLHDKIAGRAAAALITRLGIQECIIDLISKPALELFRRYKVSCTYETVVDKIACRTEDLIHNEMDLESIYKMIRQRAGYTLGLSLTIKDLRAGYENKEILKGMNLSLNAGEQLVITGDNGTGKSTLIKSLIGTVVPFSGKILLGNEPLSKLKIPSPVGYVNQSHSDSPFPLKAQEIVALGLTGSKLSKAEEKNRIEIAMRRTNCFHLIDRDINTLSGGENQKVALARCLCQKARLILLDEPTSFLDKDSKEDFLKILNQIVRTNGPTVLMVSHDHDFIEKLGWNVKTLKEGKLCLN